MKIIKTISLSLAGLIILALIGAAVIPETMDIEQEIVVNRPVSQVFAKVADLAKWEDWSPWTKLDPDAIDTLSTPSRGVGASWKWDGDKIGKGSLTTAELTESRTLQFNLKIEEPYPSVATDSWVFSPDSTGNTKVVWQNTMNLEYPIGRLMSLYMKPVLEDQYAQGLIDLKQVVEQEAPITPSGL